MKVRNVFSETGTILLIASVFEVNFHRKKNGIAFDRYRNVIGNEEIRKWK